MIGDLVLLAEVVAFLVAIMVLARACDAEGLFVAWGSAVARAAAGSPVQRLALVGLLATAVTVTLTLDATVVLLTPVLLAGGALARRTAAYASVRLANTGSTLLPVSNLTNLLAFSATGLTFGGFAWLMLPAWAVGVLAELAILRLWFRDDVPAPAPVEPVAAPLFPTAVVIAVLLGVASGLTPWVPAVAGAVIVSVYALVRRTLDGQDLLDAADLPTAVLVLLWGVVVLAVGRTPIGDAVDRLVPGGDGWTSVVLVALLGMALAGVVTNIPATLLLLPAAASTGPVTVLALLVGVNVGGNLTGIASLANLLWWRSGGSSATTWGEFHRLSLLVTPPLVVLCASVLWAWTALVG